MAIYHPDCHNVYKYVNEEPLENKSVETIPPVI